MSKRKTNKGSRAKSTSKVKTSAKLSLRKYLPLALIATVLGFLLYANTFQHEWALDDFSVIKENWVTQKGFEGIGTHLTHSYRHGYGTGFGTLYRPLTPVMFSMEWAIAPDSPGFMHFVNALFYGLTGFVLFFTLARVLRNYNILLPFAATILFVAHPLHTESVANIKGRDDIMGFFFVLLAIYWLWDYLKKNDIKWLAFSYVSFFLGVLSKESSVTFVGVIPLMMYFFTKTPTDKILKLTGGYLGLSLLFIFIRAQILGSGKFDINPSVLDNALEGASNFVEQKATAFAIMGRYFKLLFFPHPLVSDAGYNQIPLTTFGDWRAILSFVIHAGLGVFALLNFNKKSIFSFAILFYILTFSITSNVVFNIGTSYAERLLYVPVLGFTLALSYGLLKLFKLDEKRSSKFSLNNFFQKNMVPLGLLAIITVAFSFKTIDRNSAWKDSFTLYDTDTKISPECGKLQYHYGLELMKKGLEATGNEKMEVMNKARETFEKATQIYPKYHDAYAQLGLWHYRLSKNNVAQKEQLQQVALENYQKAIEHKPNNAKAYSNMGIIYFEKSQIAEQQGNLGQAQNFLNQAKQVYEKAVSFDPRYVDGLMNLGVVNAMQKNFPQAIKYFEEGIKYSTDSKKIETLKGYLNSARQGK